ncbi:MAG: hypothetical protein LPK07_13200 [Hymenobacteraceae bacterium]|nr:hypothetical protein [Hymenobacteraceae bacterium]MDX5482630.1 hypothetical protein [Hymenobacteraceae bacterium]
MTYHYPSPEPPDRRPLLERASRNIASFIQSFTLVIWAGMVLAVVGLVMKALAIAAGNFVFVFAMAVLVLLFLVQIGVSFFYVITNVRLALLGAISSMALVLGFIALIFRYQAWVGAQIMFFISLPLFVLALVFMVLYFSRKYYVQKPHRLFLYRNLLIPFAFILVLGIIAMTTDTETFNPGEDGRLQESPLRNEAGTDTTDMWRAY